MILSLISVFAVLMTVLVSGCGKSDSSAAPAVAGPTEEGPPPYKYTDSAPGHAAGGAPTFGKPTGTGFSTGDAAHTAQGSGLMGYHNTGAAGTSHTITDRVVAKDESKGVHQVSATTAPSAHQ